MTENQENVIYLGENPERFSTLYANADASHIIYVVFDGKRYLLSDLIEAYDAVHRATRESEKR